MTDAQNRDWNSRYYTAKLKDDYEILGRMVIFFNQLIPSKARIPRSRSGWSAINFHMSFDPRFRNIGTSQLFKVSLLYLRVRL